MDTILRMFKTRKGQDPAADILLGQLRQRGYRALTGLRIERVIRMEGIENKSASKLRRLFANSVIEGFGGNTALLPEDGPIVEVSYKRAITDPEFESIATAAAASKIKGLRWVRLSLRYQFQGIDQETAEEIVMRYLRNATVQTVITQEWSTLVPQGQAGPERPINIGYMSPKTLRKLSESRRLFLSDTELGVVSKYYRKALKRRAKPAELEMIGGAWSDHCSHKIWLSLGLFQALQRATKRIGHRLVVSAFHDNSGVMMFFGGWALCFKAETHISPTFGGDPYGGVMTKHGGVIRDVIFTGQGGYPIMGTTIMATCNPNISWDKVPSGAFHPLNVLLEAIRGTRDYTNPMGIPMGWSQYLVHPRNWKGLALGGTAGIIPTKRAQKGVPRPGDFVVLIGGKTGLDGLHGATVASAAMTSETATKDAAHVQIGMPIEERMFMEAMVELRDAGCICACTDCGAAGLSSAVGEMGSACGVWVNLHWVPRKCAGMANWEVWLSESQERGVLAIPPHKLQQALEILARYDVRADVIGVFTESARCQVVNNPKLDQSTWVTNPQTKLSGKVAVDLPYSFLTASCPLPTITVRKPAKPKPMSPQFLASPQTQQEWSYLLTHVLGHYNLSDQSAAANQYDHTVQGKTARDYLASANYWGQMPEDIFVSAPVFGKTWGAGISVAVNQLYGEVDPAGLGKLMLASAVTKLVAAGFKPSDITLCANVYSPPVEGSPENAWRLVQLVRYGYAPGTVALMIPVISGKDSGSGRFVNKQTGEITDAPLTLCIMAVGRMRNVRKLLAKPFRQAGDQIVLFQPGLEKTSLGGSVYLDLFGQRGDQLPRVNLRILRSGLDAYADVCGRFTSATAVAEGGLFRRLFEQSIGSNLGCAITVPEGVKSDVEFLLAENHGSIVFTLGSRARIPDSISRDCRVIGHVMSSPHIMVGRQDNTLFNVSLETLSKQWRKTFTEVAV